MGDNLARILMILGGGFTDAEASLKILLERKGHNVRVAGKSRSPEKSREGNPVTPDIALYEVNPDYYEFVVIVGDEIKDVTRPDIITTVRKCAFDKKGAAGINNGPVLLAFSGVLNGKRATVGDPERYSKFLKNSGAHYVNEDTVVDGKIITAMHPEAAEDNARRIIEVLNA